MSGAVEVYQRGDGRIYFASQSRVEGGPLMVNGWCKAVADDVADEYLVTLVQEGLRIGAEPGRRISLDDREEFLRPLLKLAKVKSFAAFARGARAVGVGLDESGAYVIYSTENRGVRSGFRFTDKKVVVPAESGADEIGRGVRSGLASSVLSDAARPR